MRRRISIFDRETGEFVRGRTINFGKQPILCKPNEDWVLGRHDGSACRMDVETGQIVPLHAFAPVVAPNRLSGLPEGTKAIYHLHTAMIAADGVLQVNVQYPQTIRVSLSAPLYYHQDVTLECTPDANAPGGCELPQDCARLRKKAYPPLADLADAIVKRDDDALDQYRVRCHEVKARFPKTERKV